jgi:hypothetical protein
MAENTNNTSGIVIDREEQRQVLGRVYSLLLRLAAQREAAGKGDLSEASEPAAAGDASASQSDGPEE